MDCKDIRSLIDAFIDNELDISGSIEVEKHLGSCEGCRIVYGNLMKMRSALSGESVYFTQPEDLKKKLSASLNANLEKRSKINARFFSWQRAAYALAFAVIVLVIFLLYQREPSTEGQLTEQVVNNHMRSLLPNHLTDVQNSDQHTVKPWFNGKIDFSPPVADLSSDGFNLFGGRLDYINGQPVAVIVYQRKSHIINLFFWFSDNNDEIKKKVSVSRGYNLIHWTKGNRNYWAVSDINLTELDEFASKIQGLY